MAEHEVTEAMVEAAFQVLRRERVVCANVPWEAMRAAIEAALAARTTDASAASVAVAEDELPPFGSAERIGLDRALSALEALAEIWSAEIDLRAWATNIAKSPPENHIDAFYAVAIQCFIEGAYRHHLAALASSPQQRAGDGG